MQKINSAAMFLCVVFAAALVVFHVLLFIRFFPVVSSEYTRGRIIDVLDNNEFVYTYQDDLYDVFYTKHAFTDSYVKKDDVIFVKKSDPQTIFYINQITDLIFVCIVGDIVTVSLVIEHFWQKSKKKE